MLFYGVTRYGKRAITKTRSQLIPSTQIEYLVVCFDEQKREVKLSLRQADILQALASDEELLKQGGGVPDLQVGSGSTK